MSVAFKTSELGSGPKATATRECYPSSDSGPISLLVIVPTFGSRRLDQSGRGCPAGSNCCV
jgi:hypothetical protein